MPWDPPGDGDHSRGLRWHTPHRVRHLLPARDLRLWQEDHVRLQLASRVNIFKTNGWGWRPPDTTPVRPRAVAYGPDHRGTDVRDACCTRSATVVTGCGARQWSRRCSARPERRARRRARSAPARAGCGRASRGGAGCLPRRRSRRRPRCARPCRSEPAPRRGGAT